jgi:hypothetical protein
VRGAGLLYELKKIRLESSARLPEKMQTCRVSGCRFADTHVTSGHRCGTCGRYGHGQLECRNVAARQALQRASAYDAVAVGCDVPGCAHASSHTRAAHHCRRCGARGGSCCLPPPDSPPPTPPPPPDSPPTPPVTIDLTLERTCPQCRGRGPVDLECTVFTGGECVVCYEAGPCVVFSACRHAVACVDCVRRM